MLESQCKFSPFPLVEKHKYDRLKILLLQFHFLSRAVFFKFDDGTSQVSPSVIWYQFHYCYMRSSYEGSGFLI